MDARGIIRKAGCALVAFVLVSCTAELGLRVVGMGPAALNPSLGYDATLGVAPVPCTVSHYRPNAPETIDTDGLRSNGRLHGSVLVVGDSFAFGTEVRDHETWPAQLEGILGRRVLNGGVPSYGLDQVVLRAERLVEEFGPEIVILGLFPNDVARLGLERRERPKPYFVAVGGELRLRNVPVRRELGEGLALAGLTRRATGPRYRAAAEPVDVEEVSRLLLRRFGALEARKRLMVIYGHEADDFALSGARRGAEEAGIEVLDLGALPRRLFVGGDGHFTPAGNRLVAEAVARWVTPPSSDR